ncbi:hypothetical protein GCM10023169_01970 [Georgenia halophila]|uniref:Uncharacterized protein n=1 Tax=Georgenia halophila TaxID=620889 RepID=A0ABP8KSV0_9MICO
MYAMIWRLLPGPSWFKAIEALVLLAVIVAALFTWVYPWAAEQLNLLDSTVVGEGG